MNKVHIKMIQRDCDREIYRLSIAGYPSWECVISSAAISAGLKKKELAARCEVYLLALNYPAMAHASA